MTKTGSTRSWTLYGVAMILTGLVPIVRTFVPFWLRQVIEGFPRLSYGFFIGKVAISTDFFWVIYLLVMSGPFVIYGIVCMVQARSRSFATHTLSQSVSPKTVVPAALCGFFIGIALACGICTIHLLAGPEKYPINDFCGSIGALVGYALATVSLIVYAHARRRLFIRKGLVFEIGVAFFGVLVGALFISVLYYPLEAWEDAHGYLNALVERIQGPAW